MQHNDDPFQSLLDIDVDEPETNTAEPKDLSPNNGITSRVNSQGTIRNQEPKDAPLSAVAASSSSRSTRYSSSESSYSHHLDENDIPFKYNIPYSTTNTFRGMMMFDDKFPICLNGVIDKAAYINVVAGANETVNSVIGKKRYSNTMTWSLIITGSLAVFPLFALIHMEENKGSKIQKALQKYVEMINPQFAPFGLKWDASATSANVNLCLEIRNLSLLPPETRRTYMRRSVGFSFYS